MEQPANSNGTAPPIRQTHPVGAEIVVEGVTRRFEPGSVEALRALSLRIAPGEFIALTGPSGSGKSTLLHLLAALDAPSAGRVLVDGIDTAQLRGAALAAFRRQRVGLVFQRFRLLPGLTALENVMAPLLPYVAAHTLRTRARKLLTRTRMDGLEERLPGELSGGEQQRIAIARALIAGPSLLLADEPTGSLDTATGFAVMDLLQALRADSGMTLIVATHDPRIGARAERQLALEAGQLCATEPPGT